MNRHILFALPLLLLASAVATSQELSSLWYGSVGGGLVAFDNGAFSRRLQSYNPVARSGEELVYSTGKFGFRGTTLDASTGLMIGGGLVVGISGGLLQFPTMQSINPPGAPRDEFKLAGAGGGLDIGYALVNDGGTMIFPYVQGGYYSYGLDYTNNQSDSIPFFEGKPVAPGATATYTGAAPRIAIGIGLVRLFGVGPTGGGGLALHARLSWGTIFSRPAWKEPDGSDVSNGGLTPAYNGVALSVQIGGGVGGR